MDSFVICIGSVDKPVTLSQLDAVRNGRYIKIPFCPYIIIAEKVYKFSIVRMFLS